MNFADAVIQSENKTTTTNGAGAYVSTCSKVLDFFGQSASMRGKDTTSLFESAYKENPEIAKRALLWVRDVRGGAGERKVFRDNLALLAKKSDVSDLLSKTPDVGRWDDLFVVFGTANEVFALKMISDALLSGDSLCAKWAPRKGAVSEKIRKHMNITPKQYRKMIVGLTQVVETQMCSNEWDEIEYQKVPSNAHNIYKKAFGKHSPERYQAYKDALTKGETKINASTLYPHQVVQSLKSDSVVANAQWEALPNYVPAGSSILPMIDLSGSMDKQAAKGFTAKEVAAALGMYVATKNTGAFKDLWLNFSDKPMMYKLQGGNLEEYYGSLDFNNWGGTTNIEAAFALILKVAVENNVQAQEMPKTLMIFSDMQFNEASRADNLTIFSSAKQMFGEKGYNLPSVVFWNLNAEYENVPVTKDQSGAVLVSGFSPAIMEAVLSDDIEQITPEKLMLKVLMKDRYKLD